MNCNLQGNIGEAKVLSHFVDLGYEVYVPFGTATSVDMIVCKDSICKRVSVKTTTNRDTRGSCAWRVNIRQNIRGGNINFDPSSCDIVVVYIVEEDRIIEFDSSKITQKTTLSIQPLKSN